LKRLLNADYSKLCFKLCEIIGDNQSITLQSKKFHREALLYRGAQREAAGSAPPPSKQSIPKLLLRAKQTHCYQRLDPGRNTRVWNWEGDSRAIPADLAAASMAAALLSAGRWDQQRPGTDIFWRSLVADPNSV